MVKLSNYLEWTYCNYCLKFTITLWSIPQVERLNVTKREPTLNWCCSHILVSYYFHFRSISELHVNDLYFLWIQNCLRLPDRSVQNNRANVLHNSLFICNSTIVTMLIFFSFLSLYFPLSLTLTLIYTSRFLVLESLRNKENYYYNFIFLLITFSLLGLHRAFL